MICRKLQYEPSAAFPLQEESATGPVERQEVVVREGGHALRDHVAGQAELHRDAALPKAILQSGI